MTLDPSTQFLPKPILSMAGRTILARPAPRSVGGSIKQQTPAAFRLIKSDVCRRSESYRSSFQ
jgi:hypothetical protein